MSKITVLKKVLGFFLSTALMLSALSGCSINQKNNKDNSLFSNSLSYHSEVNNYFEYKKIDAPGKISAIIDSGKLGDDYYISGYSDITNLMSVNYSVVIVNSSTGEVSDCSLSEIGANQISGIFVSGNGDKVYVTYYDAGYNTVIDTIDVKTGNTEASLNLGKEIMITSLKESDGKVEVIGLSANADFSSSPFIYFLDSGTLEITETVDVSEKVDLSWAGYTNVVPSKEPGVYYTVLFSKDDNKLLKVVKLDQSYNVCFESEEIQCGELFQAGLFENKDGNAGIVLRSSTENLLCADIIDKNTGMVTHSPDFIPEEDISGLYTFVPDTDFDFMYSTLSGVYKYDTEALASEKIIDFEKQNIPDNCRNPYFINTAGNYVVLCGQGDPSGGGAGYVYIDEEGNQKEFVNVYNDNLYSVSAGNNRSFYYTESVNSGSDIETLQLVKADSTGELKRADVTTSQPGSLFAGMIRTAKDGSVMLGVTNSENGKPTVLMYNSDLEKIFEADCPNDTVIDVIAVKDSMLMICSSDLYIFDIAGNKLDKTEVTDFDPSSMTAVESCDEEFDFYYKTPDGIFGYDIEKKESQEIINWIDSDFTNKVNSVIIFNRDKILAAVSSEKPGESTNDYYLLSRADESTLNKIRKKKTFVAGVMNLTGNDDVIDKIIEYNKNNDKYRIVLNDYSKYGYEDKEKENEGGMAVLNRDLRTGNVPDVILSYGDIDFSALNLKNTFADLSVFMDKDSEIHKEDFHENITESYTHDGKLYAMPVKFGIDAISGNKSEIGEDKGWTLEEFLDFSEKNEKTFKMSSLAEIDMSLISANLDEFVNFKKKKCSFDKPEFVRLIEMIKKQSTDENAASDEYIYPAKIVGIGDYMSYLYFVSELKNTNTEPVFKGFPGKKESGANINPQMILAISDKSKNKEQAWDFAKYFLSKDYQDSAFNEAVTFGFPVRKDSFENMMKNEAGKDFSSFGFSSYINSNEASELLKQIVNDADSHVVSDSEIKKILRESLDKFYSGEKSSEDTAKEIQSKVTEYLQKL